MTWIPTFEFGIWNAWILALFLVLHPLVMNIVDKAVGVGDINKKMGDSANEDRQSKSIPIPTILLIVLFVFSIFLPLKSGTLWLFLGIAIYIVGVAMFLSAIITVAKTPLGQIFSSGMYRYSRHPLYLSFLILFVGISLATLSWLFFLLSMIWMIFPLAQVEAEERGCLKSFGVEYQVYMNRTPKWLGIPKPKKDTIFPNE